MSETTSSHRRDGWPRGRWNGRRIVGVTLKIRLDVTDWGLNWFRPYGSCAQLGPLRIWAETAFHHDDR